VAATLVNLVVAGVMLSRAEALRAQEPALGLGGRASDLAAETAIGGPAMIPGAKYGHTNLVAEDWRGLARFYEEQFGCIPVPPERDFKGKDLERGTGIPGAELRGAHLRLPGHGAEGPTLEIFNYNILKERPDVAVNRPGFGHIAFVVEDVPSARAAVLAAGGQPVGEVVTLTTATGSKVTWVYVTDPEGNVIELQSWSK
jgi:predicted enzyme related to lactoylglutathione lyase